MCTVRYLLRPFRGVTDGRGEAVKVKGGGSHIRDAERQSDSCWHHTTRATVVMLAAVALLSGLTRTLLVRSWTVGSSHSMLRHATACYVMTWAAVALLSGCAALYTAADLADVLREPTPAERCAQRGEDYVPDVTDPRTGAVVQPGGCRVRPRPTKEIS